MKRFLRICYLITQSPLNCQIQGFIGIQDFTHGLIGRVDHPVYRIPTHSGGLHVWVSDPCYDLGLSLGLVLGFAFGNLHPWSLKHLGLGTWNLTPNSVRAGPTSSHHHLVYYALSLLIHLVWRNKISQFTQSRHLRWLYNNWGWWNETLQRILGKGRKTVRRYCSCNVVKEDNSFDVSR
jgi:hypothetical protein